MTYLTAQKKLSFRIFADDTNMFFSSDNLYHLESIMNEELNLVFKYCNINKLSINFTKTTYMIISSARLVVTPWSAIHQSCSSFF